MLGRRFERTRSGDLRVRLPRGERELLRRLPQELEALLEDDLADPALGRLRPPAYEDEEDEFEYQRLMGGELLDGRRRALRVLGQTAGNDRLSADELECWLGALNDLRLVLGTRLDVTEETFDRPLRPDDPHAHELSVYAYLTWLQGQLVEAAEL